MDAPVSGNLHFVWESVEGARTIHRFRVHSKSKALAAVLPVPVNAPARQCLECCYRSWVGLRGVTPGTCFGGPTVAAQRPTRWFGGGLILADVGAQGSRPADVPLTMGGNRTLKTYLLVGADSGINISDVPDQYHQDHHHQRKQKHNLSEAVLAGNENDL